MDISLPDAVCSLRPIAYRYLPIYEARKLTEPYYCAVRSGGPQSLLVRVNDQTLTLLLGLRFLYSREHIQDILHSLTVFVIIIIGIQPLGRSVQRPEFSQATGMALVRCILGKFLGVACHCFPPLFFRRSHFPGASTSATT